MIYINLDKKDLPKLKLKNENDSNLRTIKLNKIKDLLSQAKLRNSTTSLSSPLKKVIKETKNIKKEVINKNKNSILIKSNDEEGDNEKILKSNVKEHTMSKPLFSKDLIENNKKLDSIISTLQKQKEIMSTNIPNKSENIQKIVDNANSSSDKENMNINKSKRSKFLNINQEQEYLIAKNKNNMNNRNEEENEDSDCDSTNSNKARIHSLIDNPTPIYFPYKIKN